jgi:hypothetical protein
VEEDWKQLAANEGMTDTELYASLKDSTRILHISTHIDQIHALAATDIIGDKDSSYMKCRAYSDELWTLRPGATWAREKSHMPGQAKNRVARPEPRAGAVTWVDGNGAAFLFGGLDQSTLGFGDLWVLSPPVGDGPFNEAGATGSRELTNFWTRLGGPHGRQLADQYPAGNTGLLQPSDVIEEYLEASVLRPFPAGRAFATATVFSGIPTDMASTEIAGLEKIWGKTAWGRHMDTPAFQRAASVGWSGYMFGGVMGLDLRAGLERAAPAPEPLGPKLYPARGGRPGGAAGRLGVPQVIPMALSDVWHFETTACPDTAKPCFAFNAERGQTVSSPDGHELGFGLRGDINVTWTYMNPPSDDRTGSCKYFCHHVDNPATINGAKTAWSSSDAFDAYDAMLGSFGPSWPGARYRHAAWAVNSMAEQGHKLYVFGGIGGKYEVLELSDLWQMSRENVRRDGAGFEVLNQAGCEVSWLYLGGDHSGFQVLPLPLCAAFARRSTELARLAGLQGVGNTEFADPITWSMYVYGKTDGMMSPSMQSLDAFADGVLNPSAPNATWPAPRHGAAAWVEGSTAYVLGGQTVLHLDERGRFTSFLGGARPRTAPRRRAHSRRPSAALTQTCGALSSATARSHAASARTIENLTTTATGRSSCATAR